VHYNRHVRAGVISIRSDIDRFQAKTAVGATCYQGTNCVIWTGAKTLGYGSFRAGGHAGPAHRWIYTQRIGPVPAGMQVDHLCHNADLSCAGGKDCLHRAYVNVLHLEAVSPLVNSQRGRKSDPWTHCKYGHPMTPDNLHTSFGTRRRCKTCANAASRAFTGQAASYAEPRRVTRRMSHPENLRACFRRHCVALPRLTMKSVAASRFSNLPLALA
jgi:hypothetical protein